MRPRLRASLLWGVIGALTFLASVQGYTLLSDPGVGLAAKLAVAVVVGAASTGMTYVGAAYLRGRAS